MFWQIEYSSGVVLSLRSPLNLFIWGLRRFQHCTGYITTGSWKGRGNQYIEFARVLYCKLPTNGKQLPAFPHRALTGIEPRRQRWEARVLPLCHRGPEMPSEGAFFKVKLVKGPKLMNVNTMYGCLFSL